MRLLLDSADFGEIDRFMRSGVVSGVTTNPSLVAKTRRDDFGDYMDLVKELHRRVKSRHLSVEVVETEPERMFSQALQIAQVSTSITVKVPVLPETMWVIHDLSSRGIKVNATACFTAMQAKLASDAGAQYVSFFYNRMIDGIIAKGFAADARSASLGQISRYGRMQAAASVICGSIRRAEDVTECWDAGAHLVTASAKVIDSLIEHPKTRESIQGFQEDFERWRG